MEDGLVVAVDDVDRGDDVRAVVATMTQALPDGAPSSLAGLGLL
jgi:hypothetical protein